MNVVSHRTMEVTLASTSLCLVPGHTTPRMRMRLLIISVSIDPVNVGVDSLTGGLS